MFAAPFSARFSTLDILLGITQAVPYEHADYGIIDISARLTSAESRQCRLHVRVADNPAFTSADEYTTSWGSSGSEFSVQVAITTEGTYYFSFQGEDDEGFYSTEIIYEIIVRIVLYFTEEPQVNIRSQYATDVIVVSPTHSHTASQGVANDVKVERRVEIDEGDAAVCQAVAEELLSRWGSEQRSVAGNVMLNVMLRFKERPHVVVPQAGIDGYMVIQRKEHNIAQGLTNVTCGDIILSDSELLARILEDME